MNINVPNILVCGKTGAGKTSLVQAMTDNIVPDSAIGNSEPKTKGFNCYSMPTVNFIDSEGMEPGQTVDQYIKFLYSEIERRLKTDSINHIIHCIWYCIDGAGGRVQSADQELIKKLGRKVLVIITKSDIMRENQRVLLQNNIKEFFDENCIFPISSNSKGEGLKRLEQKTRTVAMESIANAPKELAAYKVYWAQCLEQYEQMLYDNWKREMSQKGTEANELILWGAGRAAAIAIIPIPMTDVAPLMANEAYMIGRIANVYGYSLDKTMITAFIGMFGGSFAGKMLASWIPGLKIAIAYGITYGIGVTAKAYFESGMTKTKEELQQIYNQNKNKRQEK